MSMMPFGSREPLPAVPFGSRGLLLAAGVHPGDVEDYEPIALSDLYDDKEEDEDESEEG